MDHIALRQLRRRCKMTLNDIAAVTGHGERGVCLWLAGTRPVPFHVVLIMRAIEDGLIKLKWIEGEIDKFYGA